MLTAKATAKATAKYHGLVNLGQTCYLNSILQVLFMTKEFRAAVIRIEEENPDADVIDRHLKHLFTELQKQKPKTRTILKDLSFHNVYEQQDAAEYLEKILRQTNHNAAKIFHGQMAHRTICSECGRQDDRDGAFWHLPLELVDSSRENYSVDGGIQTFFRASEFSGENQMYCDTCDAKVDATSSYVIKRHPDVLILLLKRFDFDYHHMSFIKINCCVNIPYSLKISENQTYELYAVVDRVDDLRGGHYVATIKPQDDERWFIFNDTKVTPLECNPFPDNVNISGSDDAYLLFYRKKAADTGAEEPMEVCTSEDQSATSEMHAQEGDTANVRSVPDVNHQRTDLEKRPENETKTPDSERFCNESEQSGRDKRAEKVRVCRKANQKRAGGSDKPDLQEDGVKEITDLKISNSSRNQKREKDRNNTDVDLDDQPKKRKMFRTGSLPDEGVVNQERRLSTRNQHPT